MGLAGLLFSVLDKPVYLVYSVKSHNNTGPWLLIMCIGLLVIVLLFYLIKRALSHQTSFRSHGLLAMQYYLNYRLFFQN
jgi:hypothetical protein